MYFVDDAKLESEAGLSIVKRLKFGTWLSLEEENDGRLAVWAENKISFLGLKRIIKEKIGLVPDQISQPLSKDMRNGCRVKARLTNMHTHYQSSHGRPDTVSVSIWRD